MNTILRNTKAICVNIIKFITDHKMLSFLAILAVLFVLYSADNYSDILENIAYSYIAAVVFYVVIDYMPSFRRKKIMCIQIKSHMSILNEHIRLCKNTVYNTFDFNSKEYKNSKEYADDFDELDLTEKWGLDSNSLQTRKLYLESQKSVILENIVSLLNYHDFLSDEQLKNLIKIRNSVFLIQPIFEKKYYFEKEQIDLYPNNQKEIGESIYEIDELIKEIIHENN